MTDYFFISSPLHLLVSANLSLLNPENESVAVIIAANGKTGTMFANAARKNPSVFSRVMPLSADIQGRRHKRSRLFRLLEEEFAQPGDTRLFAGNDRRIEFQYAMHVASQSDGSVTGAYMDEGAVTYMGHKSMHRVAHRFIDPLLRKLFYGPWYRQAVTTGASGWAQTVYAAFPDAVHPLLKQKHIVPIDPSPFRSEPFKALADTMLEGKDGYDALLGNMQFVMTLPHEGSYIDRPGIYEQVATQIFKHIPPEAVAIKAHPRITNRPLLDQMFPGTVVLDNTVGMELLLTMLNDDCIVAGDISSTLLTTKWLRPDLPAVAILGPETDLGRLGALYRKLDIPMVETSELSEWLSQATGAR